MTVLETSLKLLIYIAVGFTAKKLKVITGDFDKGLTKFLMAIPLPCMIINSFRIEMTREDLLSCPKIILMAIISMAALFLVIQLFYRRHKGNGNWMAVRFSLLFTNFTFIGLVVVNELYGVKGSFYFVIYTLPIRFFFYCGAPFLLGSTGVTDKNAILRKLVSAPVIAVIIGFALYLTQLQLPTVISDAMQGIGNMASPLGLMLCGITIAKADLKVVLKRPWVLFIAFLRLVVVPGAMLAAFLLVGVKTEILRTVFFYFAMPAASLTPVFLTQYSPNETEGQVTASLIVVVSTMLCVVTIPLWSLLLQTL